VPRIPDNCAFQVRFVFTCPLSLTRTRPSAPGEVRGPVRVIYTSIRRTIDPTGASWRNTRRVGLDYAFVNPMTIRRVPRYRLRSRPAPPDVGHRSKPFMRERTGEARRGRYSTPALVSRSPSAVLEVESCVADTSRSCSGRIAAGEAARVAEIKGVDTEGPARRRSCWPTTLGSSALASMDLRVGGSAETSP
jgi:hypothetical protein